MKNHSFLVPAALAALLGFAATPAYARSADGISAVPLPWSSGSCLSAYYGGTSNTCSAAVGVSVPLAYDTVGARTITVTAYAATSSQNTGCASMATDNNITSYMTSGWYYVSQFGSPAPITLSQPGSWANGTNYVQCNIGVSGRLHVVNYTP